jgi:hypothetical protein
VWKNAKWRRLGLPRHHPFRRRRKHLSRRSLRQPFQSQLRSRSQNRFHRQL